MERTMKNLLERYKSKLTFISAQHPLVRLIRNLRSNSGGKREQSYLVEGIGVHQKLVASNRNIEKLLFCPDLIYSSEAVDLLECCINRAAEVFVMSRKLNERLADRDSPDGILSLVKIPCFDVNSVEMKEHSLIVVLDGLEKPGNIGTILRTCDGAGVDAVFICNGRARMTNPNVVKSSMGGIFNVPVFEFNEPNACTRWLEANQFHICLADTKAEKSYNITDFSGKMAIVMGSERYGISRHWYKRSHQLISIPMLGICDSLNVGVAASILIYEACMKTAAERNS